MNERVGERMNVSFVGKQKDKGVLSAYLDREEIYPFLSCIARNSCPFSRSLGCAFAHRHIGIAPSGSH